VIFLGTPDQAKALVYDRRSHENVDASGKLLLRLGRKVNGFFVTTLSRNTMSTTILQVKYHQFIHLIAASLPLLKRLLNLLADALGSGRGMYGLSLKNNILIQHLHGGISTMLGL
jgi:hypothetical protein